MTDVALLAARSRRATLTTISGGGSGSDTAQALTSLGAGFPHLVFQSGTSLDADDAAVAFGRKGV